MSWMFRIALLVALTGLVVGCSKDVEGDDPGECTDGADNDRDGSFDCDDTDCAGAPACQKPKFVSVGHCGSGEATYFNCTVKSGKVLSICGAPEPGGPSGWLQYRFGKLGNVELGWPKERAGSVSKFRFNGQDYGECGMRCRCEHLYYDSGAYRFGVHHEECLPGAYAPDDFDGWSAGVSVSKNGVHKSTQECVLNRGNWHNTLSELSDYVPVGEPLY